MARKFLYFIAVCIVLVIVGSIALTIWSREATEIAFVPRGEFVEQDPLAANAYQDPQMWYSRPGLGTGDPARYQPAIAETAPDPAARTPSPDAPAAEQSLDRNDPLATTGSVTGEPADPQALPEFAVFFVPPTSYIQAATGTRRWATRRLTTVPACSCAGLLAPSTAPTRSGLPSTGRPRRGPS